MAVLHDEGSAFHTPGGSQTTPERPGHTPQAMSLLFILLFVPTTVEALLNWPLQDLKIPLDGCWEGGNVFLNDY